MNELFDRADFLSRYLKGDLTGAERVWLDKWLKEDIRNQQLLDALENEDTVNKDLLFFLSIDQTAAWQKINQRIQDSAEGVNQNLFTRYWKYAAASVVVGLISYGVLQNTYKVDRLAVDSVRKTVVKEDIPPGEDKATLTLSDGKVITLEAIKDGASIEQDGIKMTKKDGKVYYQVLAGGDTKNIHYNTIKTPAGGQYTIILPDGSQVWLNASSSLHFPTVFVGNTRQVDLTGECYFEIAKDRQKPFIVRAAKTQVEVLGTHFNVMAYADEGDTKTTLLEGAVKVGNGTSSKMILPGQQASVGDKIDIQSVNTEEAIAWKNGFFQFENQDLGTILRQLTRWYNVEIANEDQIPDSHFTAVIPRNITLSHVLQLLEMSGELDFEVVDNKITVKQKK